MATQKIKLENGEWAYVQNGLGIEPPEGVSAEEMHEYVDEAISNINLTETDPTVPAWAKEKTKPTYTAEEVGAASVDEVEEIKSTLDALERGEFGTVSVEEFLKFQLEDDELHVVASGTYEDNSETLTFGGANGTQVTLANIKSPTQDTDAANKKYVDEIPKVHVYEGEPEGMKDGDILIDMSDEDEPVEELVTQEEMKTYVGNVVAGLPTGEDKWEYIGRYNVDEDVVEVEFTQTPDGKPINLKKMYFEVSLLGSTTGTAKVNATIGNSAWSNPYGANVKICTMQLRPNSSQKFISGGGFNCSFMFGGGTYNTFSVFYGGTLLGNTGDYHNIGAEKRYFGGVCIRTDDETKCLIGAGTYIDIWGVWNE